jgi:hypothetical protein
MQTFLTSYNLAQNAAVLDGKRLFKQLVEAYQILSTLSTGKGWINHPATKQWAGSEVFLFEYIRAIHTECHNRGIALHTKLLTKSATIISTVYSKQLSTQPTWWNRPDITVTHRSRLLCKGQIDAYCVAIKKFHGVKKMDDWIVARFKKTKNQLRHTDLNNLRFLIPNELAEEYIPKNHYSQFNWEKDLTLDYIWPVP